MKNAKWAVYIVALGMIAATAGWLKGFQGRQLLGPPGVKVDEVPIYDEHRKLVSDHSVVLPSYVYGMESEAAPITTGEVTALPKDTTFGRRYYRAPGTDFVVELSVVLMGTDHTSIHQPQYCLYGQNWNVTGDERIRLHMDPPFADIPAVKLTASQQRPDGKIVECMYVYWFVSGDKITADEGSRLWSMWKTVLAKGRMERWAYISYFVTCQPGREQITFKRLERFIRESAPTFQLVKGTPSGGQPPLAAQ